MNTMHYSLPKVKAQTPVDAKASANTLANKVAEVKADKVGQTLMDVIGVSPVQTLVALQTIEGATLMDTKVEVVDEALLDALGNTLAGIKADFFLYDSG